MSAPASESHSGNRSPTFVFAGGGTGGHLYPALAIAERLRDAQPESRCVYFCSSRPIDARILSAEKAEFIIIPASPLGLHPKRLFRFIASWRSAVDRGRIALRELASKGPVHVAAMGGFVAAPVVRAARMLGLPITLINLDAVPGKANRWMARGAGRILDAAASGHWPRALTIRPIVRAAAVAPASPDECRASLGLAPDSPTLFVTGGSQGARTINQLMQSIVRNHRGDLQGWQILHQTGKDADADMQRAYDDAGIPARTVAFCRSMGLAWGAATLAVARSGAGTVGEVWANGTPTVFLPYPFHRDQHQVRNAAVLTNTGGAVVFRDWINPAKNERETAPAIAAVIADRARHPAMRERLRGLGPADGAVAAAAVLMGRNT